VGALPALHFRYGRDAALDVVNTGSPDKEATVRADVTKGGGELRIGGDHYRLLQFHWHAPSEHRINGKEFPLEMHLVHQDESGGLLVVVVLIQQGHEEHRPLARIFRNLPTDNGHHVSLDDFPLSRLLPERRRSIRYSGSLTTPPFTEPVAWVVLKQRSRPPPIRSTRSAGCSGRGSRESRSRCTAGGSSRTLTGCRAEPSEYQAPSA
jgi:carbonic anhydrase